MKFLVIGSGGREHAIIKNLVKTHIVDCIGEWVNPGIHSIVSEYYICEQNKLKDEIIRICIKSQPDIVFIGPEKPIVDGISDLCWSNLYPCVAPLKEFATIESSKSSARHLLFSIPELAKYNPSILDGFLIYEPDGTVIDKYAVNNDTIYRDVYDSFLDKVSKCVIKCDGLKGGKGVYVQDDHFNGKEEGFKIINDIKSTDNLIIEEKLIGEEFSIFTFSDGTNYKHSPPIKDFKRAHNNNKGPNTGGMGSISVYDDNYLFNFLTEEDLKEASIINETVLKMFKRNTGSLGYIGILYGSFIKTDKGIKVIEFNCRFGDSEAINVVELLDVDLGLIFRAMIKGNLDTINFKWKPINTTVKYLVPLGYPKSPLKCKITYHNKFNNHISVASVEKTENNKLSLLGSRSFAFIGTGKTLTEATNKCESYISNFINDVITDKHGLDQTNKVFYWRSDIGLPKQIDYKSSGVDINKNDILVKKIKPIVEKTYNNTVIGDHGSFGGQFILNKSGIYNDNPILVSSTDGVGTKGIFAYNNFGLPGLYNCGHDIVNHCINDILVMGAYPLFFLDYFASSKLNINCATNFINGCADACKDADCVLSGGETAEMPDIYKDNCFDLVGTMVGIRKINVLSPKIGDIVISFNSSGPHTNGYSLIRKCIDINKPSNEVLHALSMPHKSYLNEIKQIYNLSSNIIHGMCHITGGGVDNINRILPNKYAIKRHNLSTPVWCDWIQETSGMSTEDMYKTFNMGNGFLVILDKGQFTNFQNNIKLSYRIYGEIISV